MSKLNKIDQKAIEKNMATQLQNCLRKSTNSYEYIVRKPDEWYHIKLLIIIAYEEVKT